MAKSIIFVLGMHRSGTSLITKALQSVGADLGNQLIPAAADNPKGFFEDEDCVQLNESILKKLHLRWDIPTLIFEQDLSDQALKPYIKDAAYLLKTKLQNADVFAVKDPRLCLLAPIWVAAAKSANIQTSFVVTIRHPLEVAHSLWKRNQFEYQKGLDLWLSHHYSLVDFLLKESSKRIVVSYENVLSQPDKELTRLARFINSKGNIEVYRQSIDDFSANFVDPGLVHSQSTLAELEDSSLSLDHSHALYQLLDGFANGRWSKDKAQKHIQSINPFALQSTFYRHQLKYFNEDIHRALGVQYHQLVDKFREDYADLHKKATDYENVVQSKQQLELEVQHLTEHVDQLDLIQKDWEITIRRKQRELFYSEKQVAQLRSDNTELSAQCKVDTDKHLQEALTRIDDIQSSLSYKAGRTLTLPIRVLYDSLVEPLVKHPENLRLLTQLMYQAVRHPVKSTQLLRWEVIRNAYITFFKDPDIAGNVVDHYVRMFEGDNYLSQPVNSAGQTPDLRRLSVEYTEPDRVSVFVINYNGRHHLYDLLSSLQVQDYDDVEIIMVDNGSSDGSVDYVAQEFPHVRIVAIQENTGFAEANNIAAEVASGRYYFLLNNDVEIAPDCISSLVACINQSDRTGAVGSKILFWKKFVKIDLSIQPASLKRRVMLDLGLLESTMPVYTKLFFASGWKEQQLFDDKKTQTFDKQAFLWFPVCEGQTTVKLAMTTSSKKPVKVVITTSVDTQTNIVLKPDQWTETTLDLSDSLNHPELCYLVNNAGSQLDKLGNAQDRGFAMPDQQQFNDVETVSALCGGAMLIRPEVLAGKPVFAKDFFAYYEDTDLSLRIREQGYDLVYCPHSIVHHKHASTSQENSAFFRFYVNRNRILFLALHYPQALWKKARETAQSELNHLQHYIKQHSDDADEQQFAQQIPEIFQDWETLLAKIDNNTFFDRHNRFPKLAVYNNFWHTLGGGEHHACVLAQALEKLGPVDLVSEKEFSIEALEQQFSIRLKHCRKRLVSSQEIHHNPALTAHYDVFVNSTYSSDLVCHAKHSYYVVSFPYKIPAYPAERKAFLDTYDLFLANSQYTAGWVEKWWERDNCKVVYPSIAIPEIDTSQLSKTKNILHVGRFFRSGHNKKQLELVRVFKQLLDSDKVDKDWTLTLIGQVDTTQQAYLTEVLEEAQGYPVEILNNISHDTLKDHYQKSAIYWHATGLGEQTERNPERNEHFGISTVEAMSYGCVPI
ncbi:MAG TPA: glycosyltransferase, partial [Crenotrichaceae bacterium]|nr:glycosyltransferase [Crenotrichaceae bacterium]